MQPASSRSPVAGSAGLPGLALLGVLLASAAPLAAHDHWIAPSTFEAPSGERVDLRLCVGHPSQFEEAIRDPLHIVRFQALGPSGTRPVPGVDGRSPAGIFRTKDEGLHVLVFQSDHALVEIEPAKYAEFLRAEGLDDVQSERERRGETGLPGRDSYARFDKALVRVGTGSSAGFDRVVGLPLELVLETDPFVWKPGEKLVLRLELEGRSLANRQVKLMRLSAPFKILLARTDDAGRVRFAVEEAGGWVASTVHQRRVTPGQELEGDWEGLWASLAFELGDSPDTVASGPPEK